MIIEYNECCLIMIKYDLLSIAVQKSNLAA